jgi:hypothetical protein
VLFFNRMLSPPAYGRYGKRSATSSGTFAHQMTDWPTEDLFPTYGTPSF